MLERSSRAVSPYVRNSLFFSFFLSQGSGRVPNARAIVESIVEARPVRLHLRLRGWMVDEPPIRADRRARAPRLSPALPQVETGGRAQDARAGLVQDTADYPQAHPFLPNAKLNYYLNYPKEKRKLLIYLLSFFL